MVAGTSGTTDPAGPATEGPLGHCFAMGDRDLVAPLHATGAPVTVVSARSGVTRFSKYASGWLEDLRPDDDALVAALLARAGTMPGPATLFYEQDDDLLFVSRNRDELAGALRFVIPDAELVERLVDKASFQDLARELDLPVPPARVLDLGTSVRSVSGMEFPLLVKPLRRQPSWDAVTPAKAAVVHSEGELADLLGRLAVDHARVMVQQPVMGPETRIESYHVYVDSSGEIAASFTGRKLRTFPAALGHSTALVTTAAADVAELGRQVTLDLGLRGVAKLDFKRDEAGRLWLLEVNPRFNLWHHLGAAAGVNIPAIVWADLVGRPRPAPAVAKAGVSWCRVDRDVRAARANGMPLTTWLRWLRRCETWSGLDPADPMPLVAGKLWAPAQDRIRALVRTRLRR